MDFPENETDSYEIYPHYQLDHIKDEYFDGKSELYVVFGGGD